MLGEPAYTCKLCGRRQVVSHYALGHPPDAARKRLVARCKSHGCVSEPEYLAGVCAGLRIRVGTGELPGEGAGDG